MTNNIFGVQSTRALFAHYVCEGLLIIIII